MPPVPPQLAKELDAALAKLEAADPAASGPHWGALHKLLLKAKADPHALMRVVGARDLAAMRREVARAKGEAVEEPVAGSAGAGAGTGAGADATAPAAGDPSAPAAPHVEEATLHDALRLFRKRLKLMQLDADSKLGHGPMSGTGQHRIQSMVPPRDYPVAVWEALARAGKLRREGDGFYSLIEQPGGAHW
jgi:hypothetical protein